MEFDPGRRRVLKWMGGLVAAPALSMLNIQTAYAEQAVNCPIYMLHGENGTVLEGIIKANIGRVSVSVEQLGEMIRGERKVSDKPLFCLTFDDGLAIQYEQAKPVLDKYGLEATFYIMGGLMDDSWKGDNVHRYMSSEQIRHLSRLGYQIGSHTVTHRSLTTLYASQDFSSIEDEIRQSKSKLEDVIEQKVNSFSYPNGSNNPAIVELVSGVYTTAVSTISGSIQNESGIYLLRRNRPQN